jgi:hypothetical protein
VVRAESVTFAGRTVRDVHIQVYSPSVKGAIPPGLLGLGLLRRYRVTMDHGGGRMFLAGPYTVLETRQPRRVRITPEPGLVED